jgi:uncharacterized membrane protein YeaQ/YmgE (transglycosylase-associated protein family)
MGVFTWIVVGALAGLTANRLCRGGYSSGLPLDLSAGLLGALLAGRLFALLSGVDAEAFSPASLPFAIAGAGVLLTVFRKIGQAHPPDQKRGS